MTITDDLVLLELLADGLATDSPESTELSDTTEPPMSATDLDAALEQLRRTAVRELREHCRCDGALCAGALCAACGAQWPCERALLAEHNLAVL